jgi:hypothetical protein
VTNITTDYYYLDLPINAKATFKIGQVKICGTYGMYVGMGLGSKFVHESNLFGKMETVKASSWWGGIQVIRDSILA